MRLAALTWLLLCIRAASSQDNCSYYDVVTHIQLNEKRHLFTQVRPVRNHSTVTEVSVDTVIYAILDVRETDQMMVSYVWTLLEWGNDFIEWNPDVFCGIDSVSLPSNSLWKPDIIIEEMTEKDKSSPGPFLEIYPNGTVLYRNDQVVVSTCQMDVYKFPFDMQQCNLTFRSLLLPDTHIHLRNRANSEHATRMSRDMIATQSEWIFIDLEVNSATRFYDVSYSQDKIIYTVRVKRRAVLYIVNFILPVLFFLFLDLASFLMSDSGGEKLGFKITVLLAVTVMQLLLNDILPTSSNSIPLIAVFCIGIFFLMLLSLLESIVVLYLINKDQGPDQDRPKDVTTQSSGAIDSLNEAEQFDLRLQGQDEKDRPGTWTQKARMIHRVFFICYVTAIVLFLVIMFYHWTPYK